MACIAYIYAYFKSCPKWPFLSTSILQRIGLILDNWGRQYDPKIKEKTRQPSVLTMKHWKASQEVNYILKIVQNILEKGVCMHAFT